MPGNAFPNYLLVELNLLAVGSGGAHPAEPVDGLIGRSGQHQELVPLVSEESGVYFFGQLVVEGQPSHPFY